MRRLFLIAAVLLPSLAIGPPVAAASPVTSFTACSVKPHGTKCTNDVIYHLGDTIRLRGRVKPSLADLRAQVWREKPQQQKFHLVATVPIGPGGGMHYVWPTSLATDPGEAQYKFQFRIPGHGRSNVVRLWLLF
ncbi:MAG: hypothetical protein M3Q23_16915 [Actinomycetota bacterium]|nr:hypothetical protein [Actinomycetota bacterium]